MLIRLSLLDYLTFMFPLPYTIFDLFSALYVALGLCCDIVEVFVCLLFF